MFSRRLLDLVQEETLVVFNTSMPRDAVRLCGKKWETQRRSHFEQAYSSVPKVMEQTHVKNSNSPEASPAIRVKNPLSMEGKMEKHRRANSRIIPCVAVTSLETVAFVAFVAFFDTARGREKKYSRSSFYSKGKKSPRLCISRRRSNEFYSTESWKIGIERFGGTHHEILGMHLVRNKFRERKGQSGRIIPKR